MVKQGYKQTEIGVIPEDWEVKELGECVDYIKGYPFKSKDYLTDGVRIIRISDTTYNSIKDESGIYVSNTVASKLKNWAVKEGDIIVTTVGSKPPMYDSMVGKTIYIKKKYEGALLNQNAVLFRNKSNSFQVLLNNLFKQKRYIEYIESIFRGNANQASITLDELFKFQIPLPPLAEQEAIAEALSDTDAWIESLEQLIAKKRLIKQGAMQELLTPPSPSSGNADGEALEPWEMKKLGEVCDVLNNLRIPIKESEREKGDNPYYGANGIQGYVKGYTHDGENVLLAEDGASDLKNYPVNYTIGKIWVNNHAHVLRGKENIIISRFLSYLLKSVDFTNVLVGGTRAKLNKSILENIEIPFPSLSEQTRIATILSDMDAELEALEQKLSKARQIKQGMMQELLTGRVRLV